MELTRRNFAAGTAAAAIAASLGAWQVVPAHAEEAPKSYTYTSEDSFLDYGDYQTHVRLHKPDLSEGETCPAMLVAHGFGASMDLIPLYGEICASLAERGVATLQIDYTDMGQSTMPFVDHSVLTDVDQALVAIDYLRGLDWVSKVGMMGHSQGGCGTCIAAAELEADAKPLDFIVLLAPANMIPDVARLGGYEAVDPWYAGMGMYFDPDHPHESDEMLDTVRPPIKYHYFEAVQGLDMWELCQQISCPALLIWGTADAPVALNIVARTQESIDDCTLQVLEGENHGFTERPDDVIALVNEFLDDVLAS